METIYWQLERLPHDVGDTKAQLGVLRYRRHAGADWAIAYTLEQAWRPAPGRATTGPSGRLGVPGESCVAPGGYALVFKESPRWGRRLHMRNRYAGMYLYPQPAGHGYHRWGCLLHPGNRVTETQGCLLPGVGMAVRDGEPDYVGPSGPACAAIEAVASLVLEDDGNRLVLDVRDEDSQTGEAVLHPGTYAEFDYHEAMAGADDEELA